MKKLKEIFQTIISSIRRRGLLSNIISVSIIIVIIIAISISISLLAKKEIEEYVIKNEELYMYFGNQKIEYDSKITLNRKNNITKLIVDDEEQDFDSEPLYYRNEAKAIIPQNMLVVFPLKGILHKRINYFSTIHYMNNKVELTFTDMKKDITGSFLYDGDDLYLFTEKVTIKFNDNSYEITPLSFVLCNYKGDLYIYNYEKDEMLSFENVNALVYAKNENYEINLSVDSVQFNDKNVLLAKNINTIEIIK